MHLLIEMRIVWAHRPSENMAEKEEIFDNSTICIVYYLRRNWNLFYCFVMMKSSAFH